MQKFKQKSISIILHWKHGMLNFSSYDCKETACEKYELNRIFGNDGALVLKNKC